LKTPQFHSLHCRAVFFSVQTAKDLAVGNCTIGADHGRHLHDALNEGLFRICGELGFDIVNQLGSFHTRPGFKNFHRSRIFALFLGFVVIGPAKPH
jgi:hypothetical protein